MARGRGVYWRLAQLEIKHQLRHSIRNIRKLAIPMVALTIFVGVAEAQDANPLDAYNVVWDSTSKNPSQSMPCGGGHIVKNVRVEDADVLF